MQNIHEIILNKSNLEQEIILNGWVRKVKKLGSLIFITLYDISGACQIAVEQNNAFFNDVLNLPKESVVCIKGKLVKRKSVNDKIVGGDLEVILNHLTIYSKSLTPPLLIQDDTDALEEVRLKNRFLDLRRPINQKNIMFRSKFFLAIRNYLQKQGFIEIETPILSKQTPEGARDYIVPISGKNAFALPQSPQIYKQLLMVSGFLKYFQLARNFRNENLRMDRQPEFCQLDMEMSFTNEEAIFEVIENLMQNVLKETMDYDLKIPFERIKYQDAIRLYGVDKPDMRYDSKIFDCQAILKNSQSKIIQNAINNKLLLKAVLIENWNGSKKDLTFLEKIAKDHGAKGLISIVYENKEIIGGTGASFLEKNLVEQFFKNRSGTLFIVCDNESVVYKSLGGVRFESLKLAKLPVKEKFKFAWVTNWPLFEYDEETKKYSASHHPFTAPAIENEIDFDTNQKNAFARQYDIVLNGFEIGGGSIRIVDSNIQNRMFKAVGLNDQQIQEKFGFLLQAFQYGVPPHGGIALGMDRLLMLLLQTDTIRDVFAFPKNSAGVDLMMNCPSTVDDDIWDDLKIQVIKK